MRHQRRETWKFPVSEGKNQKNERRKEGKRTKKERRDEVERVREAFTDISEANEDPFLLIVAPSSSFFISLFLVSSQHNGETGSCRMQLRAECSQDTLWWIERDDAKHTESYTYANVRKFESSHIFFHEIKIYFVNIIKYVYNIYYIYYNYFNNKYLLTIIYWQLIIILKRAKK